MDPQFVSSTDFHLQASSPVIDAGDNSAPSLAQKDYDGNPRIVDGKNSCNATIDMGAYEFQTTIKATLSPASLTFGSQQVGTSSAAQAATLSSTGTACLQISALPLTGDFSATSTCSATLPAGQSCGLLLTFSPMVQGTESGTLSLTSNAGTAPSLALSGIGAQSTATVSPSWLTFPIQNLGTTSAPQSITLGNTGNADLQITSISASGDFAQTNSCGSTLSSGNACVIYVTFSPTAGGARAGTLTINDNSVGSLQQVVSLSGTGAQPLGTLSPTSLTFAAQTIGSSSAPQIVSLNNPGNTTLQISSISVSGDFSQTNTCGTSLASGASCSISLTFSPTTSGARSGSLVVVDNALGSSQQTASLSGTGTPPALLTPASLAFPNQMVGTSSAVQVLTLSNPTSSPLVISYLSTTGDFSQTNNCGMVLVSGSCTISIVFTPTTTGTRNGSLYILDNAANPSQSASLTGNGVVPAIQFSPSQLNFSYQVVGISSGSQSIAISDSGTAPLQISNITTTGDFSQTNNCGASVQPGSVCIVHVVFTPTATGTRTGSLVISDNVTGSPQALNLTGIGTAQVSLSTSSLVFGNFPVGSSSAATAVTLTNPAGNPTLSIANVSVSGDFSQTNNCGIALASGGQCTFNVVFLPATTGTRTGSMVVSDNAIGSPQQTLSLTGTGVDFALGLSPSSATVSAGRSVSFTVTLSPLGGALNSNVSLNCGTLSAGMTCAFSPASVFLGGVPATTTLTVSTSSGHGAKGTQSGTYQIVVDGTAGSLGRATSALLTVK